MAKPSTTVTTVEVAAIKSVAPSTPSGREPMRANAGTPCETTAASGHATTTASTTSAAPVTALPPLSRTAGSGAAAARTCAVTCSAGREAAVDDQLRAGHERRLIAGEKQRDVGDLT